MFSEIFFLLVVIGVWGAVSYYFWFRWRRTKLVHFEEILELELKRSLPCHTLQVAKHVIYLDQRKSVKELIENMTHPKKLGRREGDPKNGIGSVVVVDKEPPEGILRPQHVAGIVTLKDLAKGCYEHCYAGQILLNRKCAEVMSQDYMIASEEAIRNDCWQVLLDARNRAVEHILIEKDNKIQGIVTDKDIFRSIEFELA
jgi:CBS domain-containing protein